MIYSWFAETKKITIQKITTLSLLSAILIVFKFVFGFVPGVEFVTSIIILYGMLLPYKDSLIIVVIFNIIVLIIYGFGPWWIMYWPIFITDVSIGRLFRNIFKNKYILALFAFILGFSIIFWYYISNIFWFGQAFAYTSLFSALPINAIEGLSNFLFCIGVIPILTKVLNFYIPKIWGEKYFFEFRKHKKNKRNIFLSLFFALISISSIATLFIYNNIFLSLSQSIATKIATNPITNIEKTPLVPGLSLNNLQIENGLLSPASILYLQSLMTNNDSAIVVIINNHAYVRINKNSVSQSKENQAIKYIGSKNDKNDTWYLSGTTSPNLGLFIKDFYLDGKLIPSNKIPALYYNVDNSVKNIFSSVGISSLNLSKKMIVSFSFEKGFSTK